MSGRPGFRSRPAPDPTTRRVLWATLVLFALGLATSSTLAVKPVPAHFLVSFEQIDKFVEQQGNIRNTTGCYWDPDDHVDIRSVGDYLTPGQSFSWSHCFIGDGGWDYGLQQPGLGLTLEVAFEGLKSISTTSNRLCLAGPEYRRADLPPFGEGYGIPGTVTLTVRNDTGRTVRFGRRESIVGGSGLMGYEPTDNYFCPSGFYIVQTGEGSWPQGGPGIWWSTEVSG
ncbi:MAG TPA: hypothetical protein VFV72_01005 [Candidatus Limnocylindrales bacterium]|nr:hypothetical protein [Candidatus Limnocylindrales bacterium]